MRVDRESPLRRSRRCSLLRRCRRPRTPIRRRRSPSRSWARSRPGQVVRIGPTAGTGTPTGDYGIGATDLCEFMEFPSGILQVCGDSFAGQGVGYGGWYSPIALHVETDSDRRSGRRALRRGDRCRQAAAGRPDASRALAAAGRCGADQPRRTTCWSPPPAIWCPQTSRLVKADPAQGNWPTVPGSERDAEYQVGRQTQISGYYDPIPTAGLADRVGVHRRQQLRPQRPGRAVPDQAARPSPTGPAGRAGRTCRDPPAAGARPPTPLWGDRIGEMSIKQIDGKTVLSYFNASTGNMEVRVADDPTLLGTAPVTTVVSPRTGPIPPKPAAARRQPAGPALRRLHLAGFDPRRAAGVHQSVEHHRRARGTPYRVIQFAVNPYKPTAPNVR